MKQLLTVLHTILCVFKQATSAQIKPAWNVVIPSVTTKNEIVYAFSSPNMKTVWGATVILPDRTFANSNQKLIRTTDADKTWSRSIFREDTTDFPKSIFASFEKEAIAGLQSGAGLFGTNGVLTGMIQHLVNAALCGSCLVSSKPQKLRFKLS